MAQVLVIFAESSEKWRWLPLHSGFGHVFLVLDDQINWILVDPLSTHLEVATIAPREFDVAAFYREQGCTVLPATAKPSCFLPFGLKTCVSFVKAFLGIRAPWIVTPHGLYRALINSKRNL